MHLNVSNIIGSWNVIGVIRAKLTKPAHKAKIIFLLRRSPFGMIAYGWYPSQKTKPTRIQIPSTKKHPPRMQLVFPFSGGTRVIPKMRMIKPSKIKTPPSQSSPPSMNLGIAGRYTRLNTSATIPNTILIKKQYSQLAKATITPPIGGPSAVPNENAMEFKAIEFARSLCATSIPHIDIVFAMRKAAKIP